MSVPAIRLAPGDLAIVVLRDATMLCSSFSDQFTTHAEESEMVGFVSLPSQDPPIGTAGKLCSPRSILGLVHRRHHDLRSSNARVFMHDSPTSPSSSSPQKERTCLSATLADPECLCFQDLLGRVYKDLFTLDS